MLRGLRASGGGPGLWVLAFWLAGGLLPAAAQAPAAPKAVEAPAAATPAAPAPVAPAPVAPAAVAPPPVLAKPAAPAPANAAPVRSTAQADLDLIKLLQAGGHAIVMRHAMADPDKADLRPLDFKAIKYQQLLTDNGRAAAQGFGEALRAIGVPIGEVLTSRYNRAYQTAVLAGFKDAKPIAELTEGSLVTSPNEQRRRASAMKQLLAAPLPPGSSRLLVTHRINLMSAFGKEWFDVKEGEASIFRLDKGTYALVARLQFADWARLAAVARAN